MDPSRFVFLDETGTVTNMARRYDRSPFGERLAAAVPHGHWRATTFIAGLRQAGIVAVGPRRTDDRHRVPPMWRSSWRRRSRPATVFVFENLAAHKVVGVRQAIAAAGATILYLPPYSPDLNPIEQLFAKLKALLRKAAARTGEELWQAIGRLLETCPPAECANYLRHCGLGCT